MKTKTIIIASILLPFISLAAGHKGNRPAVSSATLAQAQATGKMVLVGNASFGDRHIKGFLDRNFVMEESSIAGGAAYLLYNAHGELVHRVVGNSKYPYELAVKIKRGLDENTQYYTLLERFTAGEQTIELLENALMGADDAQDTEMLNVLMTAYIDAMGNEPTAGQVKTVAKHTRNLTDAGFAFLLDLNAHTEKLADIIFADVFAPQATNKNVSVTTLVEGAKAQFPSASLAAHIDRMGIELLDMRGDRAGLAAAVPAYLAKHNGSLTDVQVAYYNGLIGK